MTARTNLKKTIRILAPWALLLSLVACGWMEDLDQSDDVEPVPAPVVAEPAPAAEPAAAEPAAGGACSRVQACCRAYVEAMGASAPPASTCDAYANVAHMPSSACESAINGYRSGLNALNKSVPADCN